LIQHNLSRFVKLVFQDQSVRKGAFTKSDTEMYQAALEKPGAIAAALKYYRSLLSPQLWLNNWGRSPNLITSPTLVLWGEEDQFLSKKLTEGIDLLVNAPYRLKFLPQCGHWVQQEAPQTVNRELLDFLRRT
jgi:epoxide hydrolase 4